MNKNVNQNMLLSIIKTIFSIIIPLITYPYATRVLGVEYFGKVSFGQSIIGYVSLIAVLGISNYAAREGGIYRADRDKFDFFASQIYTISVISTVVAYFVLFVILLFSSSLESYVTLLIVQSLSILFVTIGADWINIIFEDYLYITIRTMVIQVVCLFCLFLFVKSPSDYLLYAGLQVLSNGIVALANASYKRKYCRIRLCKSGLKKHFVPIMILFSNSLAVSIYCNSDITIIGVLLGDTYTGYYALSSKIYAIIKQIIAAAYMVSVTRLTEYVSQSRLDEYRELLEDVICTIIFLSIPISIGAVILANDIVVVLSGEDYIQAVESLRILSCTTMFAVLGGAFAYCINMPFKREKHNLICTSISAIENIVLDIILINLMGINGGALATLISEFTVMTLLCFFMRDSLFEYLSAKKIVVTFTKCIISSLSIIIIAVSLNNCNMTSELLIGITACVSIPCYFIINIVLKNDIAKRFIRIFRR